MDGVFKALADASRRALLDALFEENGQTLGELCGRLAEKQAMSRQAEKPAMSREAEKPAMSREAEKPAISRQAEKQTMSRQAVMKHLAILEEANLVSTVRRGREKLHYLNPVPIAEIADRWIAKFERGRLAALARLKREVEDGR